MFISKLGWNWRHADTFCAKRPNGLFGLNLVVLQTSGHLIVNDISYHVPPNTAFLIDSCVPHTICADNEPYADDWIRFQLGEDDYTFLSARAIPMNVPIPLGESKYVSEQIRIATELDAQYHEKASQTLEFLLRAILQYLSECVCNAQKTPSHIYDAALQSLRAEIYANAAYPWNMTEIAKNMSLSVSHLHRLYQRTFGTSCMTDVYLSRMQLAQKLLVETPLSVGEIAQQCGFRSAEYFCRAFKKCCCVAPIQFRAQKNQNK